MRLLGRHCQRRSYERALSVTQRAPSTEGVVGVCVHGRHRLPAVPSGDALTQLGQAVKGAVDAALDSPQWAAPVWQSVNICVQLPPNCTHALHTWMWNNLALMTMQVYQRVRPSLYPLVDPPRSHRLHTCHPVEQPRAHDHAGVPAGAPLALSTRRSTSLPPTAHLPPCTRGCGTTSRS
jgi:hypothetical protein